MTVPVTLGAAYFDAMYQDATDPWGFEERWYEQRKYAISLAQLPARRYRRAFEPGCSIGVLSALLAPRCDALLCLRRGRGRRRGCRPAHQRPAARPGRAGADPRPVARGPLRPDRAVRGLVLLRRPRPGAGAEARGQPRSSRTGRCSPCTGATRWPTIRGPGTTFTACWAPSRAWPAWSATRNRISWPRSTCVPTAGRCQWPRRQGWRDAPRGNRDARDRTGRGRGAGPQ